MRGLQAIYLSCYLEFHSFHKLKKKFALRQKQASFRNWRNSYEVSYLLRHVIEQSATEFLTLLYLVFYLSN
jgi:hypothetical protein